MNQFNEEITNFTKVNRNLVRNEKFLDKLLDFLYKNMKNIFRKRDEEWVLIQLKWAWLHVYINTWAYAFSTNQLNEVIDIQQEIYQIMNTKLSDETSILRRIVEFDDIAGRFMELGILNIEKNKWEVFDGYYSVFVIVDDLIDNKKYKVGDKIFVFGAELLTKSAKSIYEIGNEAVLKIGYNGLRKARDESRLGYKNKVGFLTKIAEIKNEGGPVSGIIVKIKKTIEAKYLVYVKDYKNHVDNLEDELEKIMELSRKAGTKLNPEDVKCCRYCKILVEDSTGECMLTWWNCGEEDIRENQSYKFIFLTTVLKYNQIWLNTSRRTYIEKLG